MRVRIPYDLAESVANAIRHTATIYRNDKGHCTDGIAALNRDADRLDKIAEEIEERCERCSDRHR